MAIPNVNFSYLPSGVAAVSEDVANTPMIIAPSSAGTNNVPVTIAQLGDLAQLGYGMGVTAAANIYNYSQKIIYFTKSETTTQGTSGSVSKIFGNPVGTPTTIGNGNSSIIFTAKQSGLSVTILQRNGNSQQTTATFVNGLLTINLGTDNGGVGNATPNDVKTVLDGVAGVSGAMTYVPGGTGLGIMTTAANTVLPFGSTGAATTSGNPTDAYKITVKVTKAGTVGGNPSPYVVWSLDGSTTYNFDTLIPANGVLAIKDSKCDSGVTLTFTGALDVGDIFTFTTTAPTSNTNSILAAMQAAMADNTRDFGHFVVLGSLSRTDAVAIDAFLQTFKNRRPMQAMINTRDIGEGVIGETAAQYQTALSNDFAGFISKEGVIAVCAGSVSIKSMLTGLIQRLPSVVMAATIRANSPMHRAISDVFGKFATAYLAKNPIDGKEIYYDEQLTPGLDTQRFIVPRSFEGMSGRYQFSSDKTMADPNIIGYERIYKVNVVFATVKVLYPLLVDELSTTIATTPKPQGGAPAGAIDVVYANYVETKLSSAVKLLWLRPKSDGKASAVDIERPIVVLRNYNFAIAKELRIQGQITTLEPVDQIKFFLTVSVPQ